MKALVRQLLRANDYEQRAILGEALRVAFLQGASWFVDARHDPAFATPLFAHEAASSYADAALEHLEQKALSQ